MTIDDSPGPRPLLAPWIARWIAPVCCALIAAACIGAYWPVIGARFVDWDDFAMIRDNPRLLDPTTASLASFWREAFLDLYFPLTCSIWWTIARFAPRELPAAPTTTAPPAAPQIAPPTAIAAAAPGALDPAAFHLANIVAHALASIVVFAIVRRLLRRDWPALAAALVFALHPLQVESVAWASGLKDVLCGLLSLVALWQYIRFADAPPVRARWVSYAAALLAAAGAILAKPTGVVVPILILAVQIIVLRQRSGFGRSELGRSGLVRSWRIVARGLAPFVALAIAGAVLAARFQKSPGLTTNVAIPWRPLVAIDAIAFYLRKLVVPINLAVDYGRTPRAVVDSGDVSMTWVLPAVLAAIVALVFVRRRAPMPLLAACLFVAPLLPVLGIVPFDFQEFSTVADHYMYLPMLGVALAVAAILAGLRSSGGVAAGAALAAVLSIAMGVGSFVQAQRWHDTESLLRHAVQVNPRAWMALNNLANLRIEQRRWPDAERDARQSVEARPDFAESRVNLGCALMQRGDLAGAIEQLRKAVVLKPQLIAAHMNLAMAYGKQGRLDAAIHEFQTAAEIDPGYEPAQEWLRRLRPP